jgi:hypothetical protein
VLDPDNLLDLLAEGGSGYHFFGRSVERVTLCRMPTTPHGAGPARCASE